MGLRRGVLIRSLSRGVLLGDRSIVYQVIEDALYNLGMDGKACLLRAICELHEYPLYGYGLLGEIIELLLTASKSPTSTTLREYVSAEKVGKSNKECWRYYKDCPKSLFKWKERNIYTTPI